MVDLGHFALIAAWVVSLYGCVGGFIAAARDIKPLRDSAQNALLLTAGFLLLSLFALGLLFVTHDYRYSYVWRHSNNDMAVPYLISSIWGGMDGSMLLWAGIMSVYGALVGIRHRRADDRLYAWVVPVMSGAIHFFVLVVLFLTNPFRLIPTAEIPADGNGLNPLLQNPSMLIHPPCLYAGFTGFMVPCSFGLAALLSGELSSAWSRLARRWTLVAWSFLTAGIILGGNWAYIELGWGGFWAWDPVENASFLPWLSGTAYLHSTMALERRGMLKIWTLTLSVLTYVLTVFGTFLTRSGIVQSVHAFAETDVGWVFLVYIAIVMLLATVLILFRRRELRPDNPLESFLSREAIFLFNNLILLAICFSTLWGVMFPVLTEAVNGSKSVVGPPFFNNVNVPLFLVLLFLMGVGPLIAWRRGSVSALARQFLTPFLCGSIFTVCLLIADPTRLSPAVALGVSLFVFIAIYREFHGAVRARHEVSSRKYSATITSLVRQKPRRYGGLIVHVGIAVMAVSITASSAYKIERDLTMKVGDTLTLGRFQLRLASVEELPQRNYSAVRANVEVYRKRNGDFLTKLQPERRFYPRNQEVTTEVDIRITPLDDLYLALAAVNLDQSAVGNTNSRESGARFQEAEVVIKAFVNPLQMWLWVGGMIVLFGALVVMVPLAREVVQERAYAGEGVGVFRTEPSERSL